MRLRSQPVALTPVRNIRTGSLSYRVTGTIRGKQRKKRVADLAEAQVIQADWELERTLAAASVRTKPTRLTHQELAQAEAANEMLKGTGLTLVDAVRHVLRSPPTKRVDMLFMEGKDIFLRERTDNVSERQLENLRSSLDRLSKFMGAISVADVTAEKITSWLKSLGCGKKSWNNYRGCVGAFFNWAGKEPREWVHKNPVLGVLAYRKSETLSDELPERLSVQRCRELTAYLEAEKPHWVTFFATALLIGLRPEGEALKLADAIDRDGVERYLREGTLHLNARLTKDRRARRVQLPKNLLAWYEQYPLTGSTLRPGSQEEYTAIRKKFALGHDVLRHTSISASVALHGASATAFSHGNSEAVIRAHYLDLMSKEEAEAFYSIYPAKPAVLQATGTEG